MACGKNVERNAAAQAAQYCRAPDGLPPRCCRAAEFAASVGYSTLFRRRNGYNNWLHEVALVEREIVRMAISEKAEEEQSVSGGQIGGKFFRKVRLHAYSTLLSLEA